MDNCWLGREGAIPKYCVTNSCSSHIGVFPDPAQYPSGERIQAQWRRLSRSASLQLRVNLTGRRPNRVASATPWARSSNSALERQQVGITIWLEPHIGRPGSCDSPQWEPADDPCGLTRVGMTGRNPVNVATPEGVGGRHGTSRSYEQRTGRSAVGGAATGVRRVARPRGEQRGGMPDRGSEPADGHALALRAQRRLPDGWRDALSPGDQLPACLLYTSDAADDLLCVDLGGRRIIKKKKTKLTNT